MQEISRVTENTPINSEETKELIERLSDPSFVSTKNQATVKDLAETLDMDPAKVVLGLQRLREEKLLLQPEMTETYRTRELSLRDRKLAIFLISIALGISFLAFFALFQRAAISPPAAPIRVITSDQIAPVAPSPNGSDKAR